MGVVMKRMDLESAKKKCMSLPYAVVHSVSDFAVDTTKRVGLFDGECLEARYFSPSEEIHIFRSDDGFICIHTEDVAEGEQRNYQDAAYELAGKFRTAGKYIVVRNYFEFDEDGQYKVVGTRLVEIKGA